MWCSWAGIQAAAAWPPPSLLACCTAARSSPASVEHGPELRPCVEACTGGPLVQAPLRQRGHAAIPPCPPAHASGPGVLTKAQCAWLAAAPSPTSMYSSWAVWAACVAVLGAAEVGTWRRGATCSSMAAWHTHREFVPSGVLI